MDHPTFDLLFEEEVEKCRKILASKSDEYSTEDKLHNFKVAAALQGETPREALGGMLAKHIVSIFDFINKDELPSLEMWDEKIVDAHNYLYLLKALVLEEHYEGIFGDARYGLKSVASDG